MTTPDNAAKPTYLAPEVLAESITAMGTGRSPLSRLLGNLDERSCKVIPWPGNLHEPDPEDSSRTRPVNVGLWPLTDQEGRKCYELALKFYSDAKVPMELADQAGLVQMELRVQTLTLAMRHPDKPQVPFAVDANEVRRLTPDLQDALHNEYVIWLDERSPLRKIDPAGIDQNMEALMMALGKGVPPATLLSYYDIGSLRLFLARSLHRLMSATRPSYSGSSSASDGAASSSEIPGAPEPGTDAATGNGKGLLPPDDDDDDGVIGLRAE